MTRLWSVLLLTLFAPMLSHANTGDRASCRVALNSRAASVEAVARKMVRASELTDLNQKSQQLRQIQLEMVELQKTHGQQIIRDIERRASALQAKKNGPPSQAPTKTREAEADVIFKYQRLEVLLPEFKGVIASSIGKMIYYENSSVKLLDLNDTSRVPDEIKVEPVNLSFAKIELASNAQALVLQRIGPGQPDVYLQNHVDLVTGLSTPLPNLKWTDEHIKLFPDGAFILSRKGKKNSLHSTPHAAVDTSLVHQSGHSRFETVPGSSRYMTMSEPWFTGITFNIFDRQTLLYTGAQLERGLKLNSFVFDQFSDHLFAIQKNDKTADGDLVEVNPQTGKVQRLETGLKEMTKLILTGDQSRLLIYHRPADGVRTWSLYDLATRTIQQINDMPDRGVSELVRSQPNGALVFMAAAKPSGTKCYYILDSKSGIAQELTVLEGKDVWDADFSPDGSKLWLRFRHDPALYELR